MLSPLCGPLIISSLYQDTWPWSCLFVFCLESSFLCLSGQGFPWKALLPLASPGWYTWEIPSQSYQLLSAHTSFFFLLFFLLSATESPWQIALTFNLSPETSFKLLFSGNSPFCRSISYRLAIGCVLCTGSDLSNKLQSKRGYPALMLTTAPGFNPCTYSWIIDENVQQFQMLFELFETHPDFSVSQRGCPAPVHD